MLMRVKVAFMLASFLGTTALPVVSLDDTAVEQSCIKGFVTAAQQGSSPVKIVALVLPKDSHSAVKIRLRNTTSHKIAHLRYEEMTGSCGAASVPLGPIGGGEFFPGKSSDGMPGREIEISSQPAYLALLAKRVKSNCLTTVWFVSEIDFDGAPKWKSTSSEKGQAWDSRVWSSARGGCNDDPLVGKKRVFGAGDKGQLQDTKHWYSFACANTTNEQIVPTCDIIEHVPR